MQDHTLELIERNAMIGKFRVLTGLRVKKAVIIHDYLQLYFENGGVLNLYNELEFFGLSLYSIESLVGKVITSVYSDNENFDISFGDKIVRVKISDKYYNGPEAMQYSDDSEDIIWS